MKQGLLLISAIPPFPRDSGGATRLYYTLTYLSQRYEIHFVSFGAEVKADEREFLDQHCASWRFFPIRKRTLFSSLPYPFSCWKSGKLERYVGKILDEHRIDKVRIEFSQIAYLWQFLPRNLPTTLVAHDIAAVSYARREKESRAQPPNLVNWVGSGMIFANSIEVKAYEKLWLPLYSEVVAMSAHDSQVLQREYQLKNIRLEPNGIEKISLAPRGTHEGLVCGFIGSPWHTPNQQAITFTLEKILPLLDERGSDYRYLLAGSHHQTPESARVHVVGEVKNSEDFFGEIDVLVAPLFAGSGTRVKILESLSQGVPVITTPIGAEGLDIRSPFLQVIAADNKEQLAAAFADTLGHWPEKAEILTSAKVREQLTKQLRPYLWERTFAQS